MPGLGGGALFDPSGVEGLFSAHFGMNPGEGAVAVQ